MKNDLTTILEIERGINLLTPITSYETPLWRAALFNAPYKKKLPFMKETDVRYPGIPFIINTLIVDNKIFLRTISKKRCLEYPGSWCYNPDNDYEILIHYEKFKPEWLFLRYEVGTAFSYSNNEIIIVNNTQALPILLTTGNVIEEGDTLEYPRMKFQTSNVTLINTGKQFDKALNVYGFNMNIFIGESGWPFEEFLPMMQNYVDSYTITPTQAQFKGKDKRELVSKVVPEIRLISTDPPNRIDLYELGRVYPFIGEAGIDKIVPNAYGYCYKVPGVCLNENQAVTSRWRHYKFADTITSKLNDSNFILEAEIDDKWVRLPRNAAEFQALGYGPASMYNYDTMRIFVNQYNYSYIHPWTGAICNDNWKEEGTVSIPVIWAHAHTSLAAEDALGATHKIRLSAVFVNLHNPGDIIKEIFWRYAGLIPTEETWTSEFEKELRPLADIGIALIKQEDIYKITEKIQNASTLGFKLSATFDKFTARVDNPNRIESFRIRAEEIINIESIKVDMNAEQYASYADILYQYGWEDETSKHCEDHYFEEHIVLKRRKSKLYKTQSYLNNLEDAKYKASVIMQIFFNELICIENITLFGLKYFTLRPYDIGWLTIKDAFEGRVFYSDKELRVMVTKVTKNLKEGTVTVNFVRREKVQYPPPPLEAPEIPFPKPPWWEEPPFTAPLLPWPDIDEEDIMIWADKYTGDVFVRLKNKTPFKDNPFSLDPDINLIASIDSSHGNPFTMDENGDVYYHS